MNNVQLKILAGEIVVRSKLTKPAKLQLLNYLQKEATEAQVKAFLLDGEIVSLDEHAEEIVNERFEVSEAGGRIAKLRKTYMSVAASGGGMSPLWILYRKIRSMYDSCTRRCGKYELNTTRRQHCMIKCKVQKIENQLKAAQQQKNSTEITKLQSSLAKAKAQLMKSQASFKARGAEE